MQMMLFFKMEKEIKKLYYLDVETEGINTDNDQIITIQYQQLDLYGKAIGELIILKCWEGSEENIIKEFYKTFMTKYKFDFTPVGSNLVFDLTFLIKKFKKYNLPINENLIDFIFSRPYIDIKSIQIIANDMQFKGHSLDSMTTKIGKGCDIPIWFAEKKYDLIIDYIKQETEAFIKAFQIIIKHQEGLKEKLIYGK